MLDNNLHKLVVTVAVALLQRPDNKILGWQIDSALKLQFSLYYGFNKSGHIDYLFPENRFGLTTVTLLFPVVTSSSLGSVTLFGLLVLSHFVKLMHLALFAKGLPLLRNVDL